MEQKKSSGKQISVELYLKKFPPYIRELTNRLRMLIKQTAPGCIERVYTGWKLIGYRAVGGRKSHYFGFLYPDNDKVVLGFEYGTMLSDPHGVLEGTGKQVRVVTIRSPKKIKKSILVPLIAEAASIAVEQKKGKR